MALWNKSLAAAALVTSVLTASSGNAATTELMYPPAATNLGLAHIQVSGNGRYVLFTELSSVASIKVHDRQTGGTELVNTDVTGTFMAASASIPAKISADGRFVVFTAGGAEYVKDRLTGAVQCASVDSTGAPITGIDGNGNNVTAAYGAISADGGTVAFVKATKSGYSVLKSEIYVTNMAAGTSVLVAEGGAPAVSADGRYIAFVSRAQLTAEPLHGAAIFTYDTVDKSFQRIDTNATSCVTDIYGFSACDISDTPTISNDGRFVSYQLYHETLTTDGGGHITVPQAFVVDRTTKAITRADFDFISKNFPGSTFTGMYPSISGDGNYVLFNEATDRLNVDGTPINDLFVFERATGNVARVSLATNGEAANSDVIVAPTYSSINTDGSTVAFISSASNLVPGVAYDAIFARNTDGLGYPLTFAVTNAGYDPKSKKLTVNATSTKGAYAAGMEVLNNGAMTWSSAKSIWTYSGTLNSQPDSVRVGNIEGYAFAPVVTTATPTDTVAPVVISSIPSARATGVQTKAAVTVNFSETVAKGQKFSSIALMKGSSTVRISANISGSKLTIQPSSALSKNTTYTVTIPAQAVKDAAGNQFGSSYSFSFTTGNL